MLIAVSNIYSFEFQLDVCNEQLLLYVYEALNFNLFRSVWILLLKLVMKISYDMFLILNHGQFLEPIIRIYFASISPMLF